MKCPRCTSENTIKRGAGRAMCKDCGTTFNSAERQAAIASARERPPGQRLRGTSTLVDMRTGEPVMEWVKTTEDAQQREAALVAIRDGFTSKIPRERARPAPAQTHGDLLNCYVLTDYHLGMLAWGEETGADWDVAIAEERLVVHRGSNRVEELLQRVARALRRGIRPEEGEQ